MTDYWNDVDFLVKLAKVTPYSSILLGFIVAAGGQFVKARIDSKITELDKIKVAERKKTPPSMDIRLGNSSSTRKPLLELVAKNEIPFTARWLVVTEGDSVVSGIMIEDLEIHPTKEKRRFLIRVPINDEKVRGNYIELRFKFNSLYAAELNDPTYLKGEIVKKYRFLDGFISPLP